MARKAKSEKKPHENTDDIDKRVSETLVKYEADDHSTFMEAMRLGANDAKESGIIDSKDRFQRHIKFAIFFGGGPGTGKSGLMQYVPHSEGFVYININEIIKRLPEYEQVNSNYLYEEARDIVNEIIRRVIGKGKSFIYESAMRKIEESKEKMDFARSLGYRIIQYSTNAPMEVALKRATESFLDHVEKGMYFPIKKLVNEHDETNRAQFELLKYADEGAIFDTDVPKGEQYKVIVFKNWASEVVRLGDIGNEYCNIGQVKKAIPYYEKELAIAREIGDRQGEGNAIRNLGLAYIKIGLVEKAIKYYQQALAIAQEIGDRQGEGNALGNLGVAYNDIRQIQKAIHYLEQALAIARETHDKRSEENALGGLGNAYSNIGKVEEAIGYYKQALAIAQEIGDRGGEGNALGNLGIAYKNLGELNTAIQYYRQAHAIAQELGDQQGEMCDLINMGNVYNDILEFNKAVEYFEQALVIAQEIGDRQREENTICNLGVTYRNLGQVEKAIMNYEQSLEIAQEIGDISGEANAIGNLGDAYSDLGQIEKAMRNYDQVLEIAKEIEDRNCEASVLICIGESLINQNLSENALDNFNKAISIANELNNRQVQNGSQYGLALAMLLLDDLKSAQDSIEAARRYEYPPNQHNVLALSGVIALRNYDNVSAKASFDSAIALSDDISGKDSRNHSALFAKGLALCGLALCEDDNDRLSEAISAYRYALAINSYPGVKKRAHILFDELKKADEHEMLAGVREVLI